MQRIKNINVVGSLPWQPKNYIHHEIAFYGYTS